jgi:hypothetical protein
MVSANELHAHGYTDQKQIRRTASETESQ